MSFCTRIHSVVQARKVYLYVMNRSNRKQFSLIRRFFQMKYLFNVPHPVYRKAISFFLLLMVFISKHTPLVIPNTHRVCTPFTTDATTHMLVVALALDK